MLVTALVWLVALAIPYSPIAGALGFVPLPLDYLGIVLLIVVSFLISAELTKRWFYRHLG